MSDLRTLTLALLVKDEQFRKGLKDSQKASQTFSEKIGKTLKAGALAFGAIGAAAGTFAAKIGKDAVLAAADFNEELSKSEVLFGDAAKGVQRFAKDAVKSIGLNRLEALKAASTFAVFGKSAGLSGKELENFSTDFVTLAADLASFNNTTPEQAIQAIGAALRGESEPIRNYGVLINEASLKQIALRDGIIKTTKDALTPQEKVLATTKLLFEQTLDAQGDFDRTRDSFTNTLKTIRQSWADIRIEIGEELLPVFSELLSKVQDDVLPGFQAFIKTLIGGPNALDASSYYAYKAQENLGEKLTDNEWAGYNLALAVRNLADAFSGLFDEVDANTGEGSGMAQFITDVAEIINKIAEAIRTLDEFGEKVSEVNRLVSKIPGLGGFGESKEIIENAPNPIRDKILNRSRPTIVNNINVRGGIDDQRTARIISNVISNATTTTGLTFADRRNLR